MKVHICFILYVFLGFFHVFSKELKLDKIAAIINNQIILESDIKKEFFFLKSENQITRMPFKISFLREQVLQKLILETLILEKAKKMNIVITDDQIHNILKETALHQKITLNQLKEKIILNEFNKFISYNDYLYKIKKILIIKMMQHYELKRRIRISKKEVSSFLNEQIRMNNELKKIDLSCIYTPFSKNMNKNVRNYKILLMNNLMKKIKKNFDFDFFYNHPQRNNVNNSFFVKEILLISLKDFKKTFSNKVDITKKNQILGPILGKDGLYIIKVNCIHNNDKEKTITEFYLQHCLIRPSIILSDAEAKKEIYQIYYNIQNNNYTFDDAVENFSHDFFSSRKKGNLGWVRKEFFNNVSDRFFLNLKKCGISKPVKSNFGWHIVKLLNIRKVDQNLEIEKDNIYHFLFRKKWAMERESWDNELKNSSYIKIIQ